jgi:hypothetical protein
MSIYGQMYTGLALFFAVAYISARYAVGIEHPWRWYCSTRMKNYLNPDAYEEQLSETGSGAT